MTDSNNLRPPRCQLYEPGHAIGILHWMATRRNPSLRIRVVHIDIATFLVDVNGSPLWYHTHDLHLVRELVDSRGPWAEFRGKGVLAFDGKLVNVREDDGEPLGPCSPEPRGQQTSERGGLVTPYMFAPSSIDLGTGRLNR
ncbi:MAG: hypothetical protein ACRDJT_06395 [Actinomycetota bacterium]